jgi:hypothetical protein
MGAVSGNPLRVQLLLDVERVSIKRKGDGHGPDLRFDLIAGARASRLLLRTNEKLSGAEARTDCFLSSPCTFFAIGGFEGPAAAKVHRTADAQFAPLGECGAECLSVHQEYPLRFEKRGAAEDR